MALCSRRDLCTTTFLAPSLCGSGISLGGKPRGGKTCHVLPVLPLSLLGPVSAFTVRKVYFSSLPEETVCDSAPSSSSSRESCGRLPGWGTLAAEDNGLIIGDGASGFGLP